MVTRFFWLRHGPTHAKTMTGWRDIAADLSDHDGLSRLNAYLPQDAVVISSDLLRARMTADHVMGGRVRLPHARDLREFNFGLWDGLDFAAVSARDPDLSRAFWENPGDIAPPEGESWNDLSLRVGRVSDQLWQDYRGQSIVVVCHFGTILTEMARRAGLTASAALSHHIAPLSVTEITENQGQWSIQRIGACL